MALRLSGRKIRNDRKENSDAEVPSRIKHMRSGDEAVVGSARVIITPMHFLRSSSCVIAAERPL